MKRFAGFSTGLGYLVGDGYCGKTKELDNIIIKEAEILEQLYGSEVQIRFNHNQESGGAWVKDGKNDCSIGLSASLRNSKLYHMSEKEMLALSLGKLELLLLKGSKDTVVYETYVDFYNTKNTLKESDIFHDGAICKDFDSLTEAVEYLKNNVFGVKSSMEV